MPKGMDEELGTIVQSSIEATGGFSVIWQWFSNWGQLCPQEDV